MRTNREIIKLLREPESGRRIIRVKKMKQKEKFIKRGH